MTLRTAALSAAALPTPCRGAVCGLLEALSVSVSVALRVPWADGENVMLTLQFAPACKLVQVLLAIEKLELFAPVICTLLKVTAIFS